MALTAAQHKSIIDSAASRSTALEASLIIWLYDNLPMSLIGVLANNLIIAGLALTTDAPRGAIAALIVIGLCVALFRVGLLIAYRRRFTPDRPAPIWNRLYLLSSIMSGLTVGLSAVFFIDSAYPEASLIMAFFITALCGGALVANAGHLPTSWSFISLSLTGLATAIFLQAGSYGWIGAVGVVIFGLVLARYSFIYRKNFIGARLKALESEALAAKLQRALQEAEAGSAAKSRFLMTMSHELRTPLNAVIGFSDLIRSEAAGPIGIKDYRDYAEDIHKGGRHLLALVDDIIDIGRIESGTVELDESHVAIADIIDEITRMIRPRLQSVDQTLHVDGIEATILADEKLLRQMLLNLLTNASKFSPAGARITLEAECKQDGLWLSVADQGIGIDQSQLNKVTEPFYQVSQGHDRAAEGTGLGLALVKAWMEKHDGSLILESSVGTGTTATLLFPQQRVLAASQSRMTTPPTEKAA